MLIAFIVVYLALTLAVGLYAATALEGLGASIAGMALGCLASPRALSPR